MYILHICFRTDLHCAHVFLSRLHSWLYCLHVLLYCRTPCTASDLALPHTLFCLTPCSGPLSPSVAAEAPHLSFLDLSHNDLSGTLDEFAAALKPTNQILQINLSYNRLTGGIPMQLQVLAAIRPVLVTMKDG